MRIGRRAPCDEAVAVGIALLGAAFLGAAVWLLLAPEAFVRMIGPVGAEAESAAVLFAAHATGLAAALLRPALRTGVLMTAAAALALLAAERWAQITGGRGEADAGSLDAGLLTLALGLAVVLLVTSRRCQPGRSRASPVTNGPGLRGAAKGRRLRSR
jgi:hypothetical protein